MGLEQASITLQEDVFRTTPMHVVRTRQCPCSLHLSLIIARVRRLKNLVFITLPTLFVFFLLLEVISRFFFPGRETPNSFYDSTNHIVKFDRKYVTGALIKQIKQEAEAAGSRLVVSMVPSPFQIYPDTYVPLLKRSFEGDPIIDRFVRDMQRPQKFVAEICREADIPFQDLMPTFLEHNAEMLFIPWDGHLTEAGHDLMAHRLCRRSRRALHILLNLSS